jgi:hypothetical protein
LQVCQGKVVIHADLAVTLAAFSRCAFGCQQAVGFRPVDQLVDQPQVHRQLRKITVRGFQAVSKMVDVVGQVFQWNAALTGEGFKVLLPEAADPEQVGLLCFR